MDRRQRGPIALVIVAIIVGACGSGATTSPPSTLGSAVPAISPGATSPGTTSGDVAQAPGPAPTPATAPAGTPASPVAPTPTPGSVPAVPLSASSWSTAHRISTVAGCDVLSAGIDAASRYHVVAQCGGEIRYFVSAGNGSWAATVFGHPAHRMDLGPQLAFQGDTVYVGYSRIAPGEGCGGGDRDVGVYFRSRTQPNGAWSAPVRIGGPSDRLQSFRVDGQTIHATVQNASNGRVYYETLAGSTLHRYRIPGAIGGTSLRIGSDGRAWIVFESSSGLRFATFTGSGFATVRIPVSASGEDVHPALVLDSADDAHLLWTRKPGEGGCATRDTAPDDGTYYSTNANGSWTTHRITKATGETSLQVDSASDRVHALVSGQVGLWYFSKASGGPWTSKRIVPKGWVSSPVIRLDPATGKLLIVYLGASSTGSTRIYAMTRP